MIIRFGEQCGEGYFKVCDQEGTIQKHFYSYEWNDSVVRKVYSSHILRNRLNSAMMVMLLVNMYDDNLLNQAFGLVLFSIFYPVRL